MQPCWPHGDAFAVGPPAHVRSDVVPPRYPWEHAFDQKERFRGSTAASSGRSITTVNSILSLKSSGGCDGCPLHSKSRTPGPAALRHHQGDVRRPHGKSGANPPRAPCGAGSSGSPPTPSCPPSRRRSAGHEPVRVKLHWPHPQLRILGDGREEDVEIRRWSRGRCRVSRPWAHRNRGELARVREKYVGGCFWRNSSTKALA